MNACDFDDLLAFFESTTGIAKALGIRSQAVSQWKRVPPLRALQIEKLTQGQLRVLESKPITARLKPARLKPARPAPPPARETAA